MAGAPGVRLGARHLARSAKPAEHLCRKFLGTVSDPAQSDALAEHLEARRRKSEIDPERAMPEPGKHVNDRNVADRNVADLPQPSEVVGEHTAAVLARRPTLAPAPKGYFEVSSDRQAGLRVSKSHDHRIAAIQFASDRLPTRPEKDILERVGHPQDGLNFVYKPELQQWNRETPSGWTPGENTIDAHRVMSELARDRNRERSR